MFGDPLHKKRDKVLSLRHQSLRLASIFVPMSNVRNPLHSSKDEERTLFQAWKCLFLKNETTAIILIDDLKWPQPLWKIVVISLRKFLFLFKHFILKIVWCKSMFVKQSTARVTHTSRNCQKMQHDPGSHCSGLTKFPNFSLTFPCLSIFRFSSPSGKEPCWLADPNLTPWWSQHYTWRKLSPQQLYHYNLFSYKPWNQH